jgi:hypothetical protein
VFQGRHHEPPEVASLCPLVLVLAVGAELELKPLLELLVPVLVVSLVLFFVLFFVLCVLVVLLLAWVPVLAWLLVPA